MVTVNYTNIHPAAQDGEVFATITASEPMMTMWLLNDYGGALTLVMVSPTTYNVVVVDSSALPSTVELSVQGYSMFMEGIVDNAVIVPVGSIEAIPDTATTEINEVVTTDVLDNDTGAIGATVVSVDVDPAQGTAVINVNGTVTFTPAENFLGDATVTYTIENADGETSTSTLTVTVSDTVAPTQTTTITDIIDDAEFNVGSIADGGVTNDTTPTLEGSISDALDSNEVVAVYRDGVKVGEATVNGTTWTFTDGGLSDGDHAYTARVEDSAGNQGDDSNEYNIVVDTVAPVESTVITTIVDDITPVVGNLSNGDTTNDTTPTLEGTVSVALEAGEEVIILRNGVEIGTATMTDATHWEFADSGLVDGAIYTYEARVEDAAGNRGAVSNKYDITIDTSAPTQTVTIDKAVDDVAPYIGDLASGDVTNDSTPELQGHLNASLGTNEVVAIYRDGVKVGEATVNGTTWTFTDGGLSNGEDYTYTARVEDAAGNQGAESNAFDLSIDTGGPSVNAAITAINDDVAPVIGAIANNGTTNDTTPTLEGTITGTLDAGDTVVVYRDGVAIGEATVTGTTWSFEDSGLADGATYVYTVRVEDIAGNPGTTSSTYTISVDTSAPTQDIAIDRAIDNVDPVSGDIVNGGFTNDDTPELQGHIDAALNAGESVVIYRDGVEIGTATMTTGTTWSFTDGSLASGSTYEYTAYVKDAAGNISDVSNSIGFTVDTSGVNQTTQILHIHDDVAPVTGAVANNGTTNDTTPTLKGSVNVLLGAGDKVIVYRDGVAIGEATVNGTSWTFEDTLASDGIYAYTALVENAAGAQGSLSQEYTVTLDTTPPSATTTIDSYSDNMGALQGDFGSGTDTDDTTPTLNGTITGALDAGDVVAIYRDGTYLGNATLNGNSWSYTDSGLVNGSDYTYTARVEDAAGNQGATSNAFDIGIDTTAPVANTIDITYITEDTGVSGADFITYDQTLVIGGTLANALQSDESVQVSLDGGTTWVEATVSGTTWSYDNTGTTLAEGDYDTQVRIVDVAGNVGATDAQTVTVDTTPPVTNTIDITYITEDTGTAGDFITYDQTLVIGGTMANTLGANELVQVSLDGGITWVEATVNGTTWSYDNTGVDLAEGNYDTQVRIVDVAGNVGATDAQTVTVDTNHNPDAVDDFITGGNLGGIVLVSENFENGAQGWTINDVTQSSDATSDFLGSFGGTDGQEGVSKTFDFGVEHAGETVTIEFDMYELGTWDGDGTWNAAYEDGDIESFSVFVNGTEVVNQTMGLDGIDSNSDDGGEIIAGSAGTWEQTDSHHFTIEAVVDANGQVQLGFGSTTHESKENESFGIDNVTITAGQYWTEVITTDELTPISVDVLANDTDVDGDSLSISEIQGQDVTAGQIVDVTMGGTVIGTAQVVNGEIVFTPGEYFQPMKDGEWQNITFDYSISDENGGSDSANVTIKVTGITQNHAPTDLIPNLNEVDEYAKAGTVVATMIVVDEDLPDDSHTYALSGADADKFVIDDNGTITVKSDGSLYLGCEADAKDQIVTVTVTVTDAAGASYSEEVEINITNVMEAPIKYCNPCSHQDLYIVGGDNNDVIVTGFGNDFVMACAGDDCIKTGCGDDTIYAGSGDDKIYAGSGNDTIYTGLGADFVDGGCGYDTVSYEHSTSAVNIGLNGKTGSGGDAEGDRLFSVEHLIGSDYDDVLVEGCGADLIEGGRGNDTIYIDYRDVAYGGEGNDTFIIDSAHTDGIHGGEGYDTIQFGSTSYLDMTSSYAPDVSSVEMVNMTDGGWCGDKLTLDKDAVDAMTDNDVLYVQGDSNDKVILDGEGSWSNHVDWTQGGQATENGIIYNIYTLDGQTVMIDSDVSVVLH